MTHIGSRRRIWAWTAILAVLSGLFLPTIAWAQALGRAESGSWIEICSSAGIKRVTVAPETDSGSQDESGGGGAGSAPCPYCVQGGTQVFPPGGVALQLDFPKPAITGFQGEQEALPLEGFFNATRPRAPPQAS